MRDCELGGRRARDPGSWLGASPSFELLFWGKDKEGISYRPDLQPPPSSELEVKDQINWVPMAHTATQLNHLLTSSKEGNDVGLALYLIHLISNV